MRRSMSPSRTSVLLQYEHTAMGDAAERKSTLAPQKEQLARQMR
jgi:hypothetical protein